MRRIIPLALLISAPASAQNMTPPASWTVDGLLVTEGEITNCPYTEIGEVVATVHTNTAFSKNPKPEKVAKEIAEKARGMKPNAIVNVDISGPHSTMVWGRAVTGKGRAIKFQSECPSPQVGRSRPA